MSQPIRLQPSQDELSRAAVNRDTADRVRHTGRGVEASSHFQRWQERQRERLVRVFESQGKCQHGYRPINECPHCEIISGGRQ